MTREDMIDMAREAGADTLVYWDIEKLKRFAALVAAAEREACAKVCEEVGEHPSLSPLHCAESIRARGQA
jgi:hypothetical protein